MSTPMPGKTQPKSENKYMSLPPHNQKMSENKYLPVKNKSIGGKFVIQTYFYASSR